MATRKKIVFPYYNSYYTSTAIIIYQTNILKTLNTLPDDKKPFLYVWHNNLSPLEELKQINYPYIDFINIKTFSFRIKKAIATTLYKLGLNNLYLFNKNYNAIYPAYQDPFLLGIEERIYWKADFQENYYPQYFTNTEKEWTKDFFNYLKKDSNSTLVLSSNDAYKDLKKFYPEINNPIKLFRFVSHISINEINKIDITSLYKKYYIIKPYFIVCNQYWPHKNHIVVLEALKQLKENTALNFQMVFTGKTTSIRGNSYFIELKKFITDNNLNNDVIITDFIERNEQLSLMKHSLAVVQPTTFEGWSTVIEDAKALNHFVIASNIAVNKEQITNNVLFFNPNNAQELVSHLHKVMNKDISITKLNYQENIQASAKDLAYILGL